MTKKERKKKALFISLFILLPLLTGLAVIFLPPKLQDRQLSKDAEEEEQFYRSLKTVSEGFPVETPVPASQENAPAPVGSPVPAASIPAASPQNRGPLHLIKKESFSLKIPELSESIEESNPETRQPLLFLRRSSSGSGTYPLLSIRKPGLFSRFLARAAQTPKPETKTEPRLTKADLSSCLRQNSDFIAWLTIPGTNVDYPVVQTDNTDYYLKHTFSGKESSLGTLFSLGKADWKTPGKNIAIFGHAISGSGNKMFRALLQYKEESFFRSHPIIYLDSLYHTGVYIVFAAFDTTVGDFDPSATIFPGKEGFRDFISQAKALSLYDTGISVPDDGTVVSLITCDRSFKQKTGRFVVMAVKTQ